MNDPRERDLFGNPVRAGKGRRGRPAKELTEKDVDMLEAGLMKGWSNQRLADVLGVGLSTLKRNFGPMLRERSEFPDRLKLALFASTVRKALEKGDMGAVRQLRQLIGEDEALEIERKLRDLPDEKDEPEVVGKKEAQRRAAKDLVSGDAQGTWGDDLSPGYRN
ncbi:hypothetical protein [Thioclava sp. DLFJ4-1]|uniref:hypothetical protein n=1 Tax=Thioclava sp. DLFJ4-1 TaxID=1915313 RepID=UPI00117E270E|nr:hypothetical protein [Thioclava sp. DLFJ4-1]